MASSDIIEHWQSASQVDTYRDCPRKWAWRYRDGIKEPPHPSAELGTILHERLAKWLSTGEMIDPDEVVEVGGKQYRPWEILSPGLSLLPVPHPTLEVEREIQLRTELCNYLGFVDLSYMGPDGVRVVHDHKTTSDFKWAKTAEDLRRDVQSNTYAAHSMIRDGSHEVDLKWVYFRTRGKPAAKLVQLRLKREDVDQTFAEVIEPASREMIAIHEAGKMAMDLPPNPSACELYGGCPHQDRCNLSPIERIEAVMSKQTLAEKMAERKRMQAAGGAPANGTNGHAMPAPGAINPPEGEEDEAMEALTHPPDISHVEPMVSQALATAATPEGEPVKRPRGRPPGSKNKPASTPPHNAGAHAAPVARPAPAPAPRPQVAGFTLYVNCYPTKSPFPAVDFRHFVNPIAAEVARANGVPDYRLIPYAAGPAHLAAALKAHFASNPISGVNLTIDARTDEGRHVLGVLEELATVVVRGM